MYQIIDSFSAGLDTRKSPLTSPAGTLTRLVNAVITPGGEIEKRRAFVHIGDLSPITFGLAATEATLYVFGRNDIPFWPSISVPGVTLTGLYVPNTAADLEQIDYDVFDGRIYLACSRPSGSTIAAKNPHYYDIPGDDGTNAFVMVATEGAGKGYHVRTYQNKVYAVMDERLSFSAINDPVLWNDQAAAPVPVTKLANTDPAKCTVSSANIGKFRNDMRVVIEGATGDMEGANGSWAIASVNQPANTFALVGVNLSAGAAPQTSGVTADPSSAVGHGYINLSLQDADSEKLTSLEVYYDKLAVFSSEAVQIWAVDPDPLQNAFLQLLRGNGTTAPRSPLQYGSGDVQYLDQSGIRSLKARDSSNSAAVSDIGSPVDLVLRKLRDSKPDGYMDKAISLLEPSVGRFWMVFEDRVMVLSYFPGPKVTAWSEFTLPELGEGKVQHAVVCNGRIFIRSTDHKLYVYGGNDNKTYNNCHVDVRLPYLDGRKPGHKKLFQAVDATVAYDFTVDEETGAHIPIMGEWRIAVSFDPCNPDAEETLATIGKPTWNIGASEMTGYDSHFSLRFYNDDDKPVTLSNVAVHYEMGASED